MSRWFEQASEKLEKEYKLGKYDRYGDVMKSAAMEALKDFAKQDEEFAQAIVQGGTFENCMKAVAVRCGNYISDFEAYQRAAQFYFPGAKIRFQMCIDLIGEAEKEQEKKEKTFNLSEKQNSSSVIIDLSQFL